MAKPTLSNLSNELFELIVEHLDLTSICRLREVSRDVAHKAAQNTFRSFFRKVRVELAPKSLKAFAQMTTDLVGSIEDLTLVGLWYDVKTLEVACQPEHPHHAIVFRAQHSAEELARVKSQLAAPLQQQRDWEAMQAQGAEMDMLTRAFVNIKSSRHPLKTLSLDVRVIHDPANGTVTLAEARRNAESARLPTPFSCDRDGLVWTAGETFALILQCLRKSGLSVSNFDIYSIREASQSYSLPTVVLPQVFGDEHDGTDTMMLSHLSSLRMKICNVPTTERIRPTYQCSTASKIAALLPTKAFEDLKFSSWQRMLSACIRLEDLELAYCDHWMKRNDPRPSKATRTQYVGELVTQAKFSLLRRLSLGGLELATADLVALLKRKRSSLRDLELYLITFIGDPLSTAFDAIAGDDFRLEKILLEVIYEGRQPVTYLRDGQRACTRIGNRLGWGNTIHCWGGDTRRPIRYSVGPYGISNSNEYSLAQKGRMIDFGCMSWWDPYTSVDLASSTAGC